MGTPRPVPARSRSRSPSGSAVGEYKLEYVQVDFDTTSEPMKYQGLRFVPKRAATPTRRTSAPAPADFTDRTDEAVRRSSHLHHPVPGGKTVSGGKTYYVVVSTSTGITAGRVWLTDDIQEVNPKNGWSLVNRHFSTSTAAGTEPTNEHRVGSDGRAAGNVVARVKLVGRLVGVAPPTSTPTPTPTPTETAYTYADYDRHTYDAYGTPTVTPTAHQRLTPTYGHDYPPDRPPTATPLTVTPQPRRPARRRLRRR